MLRRTSVAVAWLVVAVVVALGAAGIVAALDHLPGGTGSPRADLDRPTAPSRPTWTPSSADLAALADAVGVLAATAARPSPPWSDATPPAWPPRSTPAPPSSTPSTPPPRALAARLGGDPARPAPIGRSGTRPRRSPATTPSRAALAAVDPLRPAWERLTAGAVPATELTDHLLAHDRIAATAIQSGGAGKYAAGDRPHRQGDGRAGGGPRHPRPPRRDGRRRHARRVARAQRRLRRRPPRPLGRPPPLGRARDRRGPRGRRPRTGRAGAAAARRAGPGRDPRRRRPGRPQPGGHRHRGGPRPAARIAEPSAPAASPGALTAAVPARRRR